MSVFNLDFEKLRLKPHMSFKNTKKLMTTKLQKKNQANSTFLGLQSINLLGKHIDRCVQICKLIAQNHILST